MNLFEKQKSPYLSPDIAKIQNPDGNGKRGPGPFHFAAASMPNALMHSVILDVRVWSLLVGEGALRSHFDVSSICEGPKICSTS